ncbi:NB-ARC domain-containing protein [Streptomyces sp. NPDC101118]|uniref:NB-ARC domain-containing protein n=1 Tax=Streptomyces sp. NPDC101118 TaxID=3366109 RepID=UPI00382A0E1D
MTKALAVVAAVLVAAVAALASLAANAATSHDRWPGPLDAVRADPWPWVYGLFATAAVLGVQAVVSGWRAGRPVTGGNPPRVQAWVVGRRESRTAVATVCHRRRGGPVGITTSLEGAGGYGKTTLAGVVCAHPRVRRRFGRRVHFFTIGRGVTGPDLAAAIVRITQYVTGDTTPFDDPMTAGAHLGRLLDRQPRTLLVLDDVWEPEQLEPFLQGGRRCVRLVTTRNPRLLPRDCPRVLVDEMTADQASRVLTHELPDLPPGTVAELLRVTGRWPLLLRLTNQLMAEQIETGADPADVAARALRRLREHGPAAADGGPAPGERELDDPRLRQGMVRATVEAATRLLPAGADARFAELGVFVEDEAVPVPLVARLWRATGGLSEEESRALCGRLGRLSLLTVRAENRGTLTLHDVLRDYLRRERGAEPLRDLHRALLDAVRPAGPGPAWWEQADRYLLDHLVEHLLEADRPAEALALAGDLRWVETRLHQRGPTAPWRDLARIPGESAAALARDLARTAHLMGPVEPVRALTAILHSRLAPLPHWGEQTVTGASGPATLPGPFLRNHWPLPDTPPRSLLRSLDTPGADIADLAVTADGRQLVTVAEGDGVRVWDRESGACLASFALGRTGRRSRAAALTQDGAYVAATDGRFLGVWDVATGRRTFRTWSWRSHSFGRPALAPDGTHCLEGGWSGTRLRLWDTRRGTCRRLPPSPAASGFDPGHCPRLAVGRDGAWVAAGGRFTVYVWEEASDTWRTVSSGGPVADLAASTDGTALAISHREGRLRVWRAATGEVSEIPGSQGDAGLRAGPGARRVAARYPGALWVLNAETGERLATFDIDSADTTLRTAVAPDLGWAATVTAAVPNAGGVVRVWTPEGSPRSRGHDPTGPVAVDPDGAFVATASEPDGLQLRDLATGSIVALLGEVTSSYYEPAFPPGERLLAVADLGNGARLWDLDTRTAVSFGPAADEMGRAVFSANGAWLAARDPSGISVWDVRRRARSAGFRGAPRFDGMAVSSDGTWLALRSADGLRLLDTATGRHRAVLQQPGTPTQLVVSPDDGRLAVGTRDGLVCLWDVADRVLIAVFSCHGPVAAVAFCPNGRWLAGADASNTVRVWSCETHELVAAMRTDGAVNSCAWSPDARHLVLSGNAGLCAYAFGR